MLAQAQIVNIERQRLNADTSGWFGDANLSFSLIKVNNPLYRLQTNSQVVYRKDAHQVFFIGNLQFIKAPEQNFANSGFLHTRYQNPVDKRVMWEAFHQLQFNRLLKVKMRQLVGGGGRVVIFGKESNNKGFAGAMLMNEWEILDDNAGSNFDLRWSYYLAVRLKFLDKIEWNGTTYYQPILANASDYRIYTENALLVDISEQLQFTFNFNLFYDSKPPPGVTLNTYSISNGIRYKF